MFDKFGKHKFVTHFWYSYEFIVGAKVNQRTKVKKAIIYYKIMI